jgi:hypothetical protein
MLSHLRAQFTSLFGGFLIVAGPLSSAPQNDNYSFEVDYTKRGIWTQSEDRGQACCPDYQTAMEQAARKNEKALERVFYISAHSQWDGAGAEFHDSYMRRLLLLWGDIDFAQVLARQPTATRHYLLHTLTLGGQDRSIRELFPHTYAAASR